MIKEPLPQDASQLYPSYMRAHITQEHDIVNPRFSTASSPPVLYPRRHSFLSTNDREIGRYNEYPRGPASEGHIQPTRPVLRLITPSNPQWGVVGSTTYARDRTFQDMGYQSKSLKNRPSCIVM
ncbi:reovirus sigma C capsid domain protein, putative [Rhizoctonia solani AG-3 Rhs1AP]|uniref:Reovirus sigma C capsid domain protein, putative n=2 Tax=Rhizoctonia solani AG-3 TaxID=1086053 RepID=X8JQG7_9AGAM|nr:reovirus sigma C capsid domain protein, putative [Rhizoctonia solani AG-3 Rhs1AP]